MITGRPSSRVCTFVRENRCFNFYFSSSQNGCQFIGSICTLLTRRRPIVCGFSGSLTLCRSIRVSYGGKKQHATLAHVSIENELKNDCFIVLQRSTREPDPCNSVCAFLCTRVQNLRLELKKGTTQGQQPHMHSLWLLRFLFIRRVIRLSNRVVFEAVRFPRLLFSLFRLPELSPRPFPRHSGHLASSSFFSGCFRYFTPPSLSTARKDS